MIVILMKRKLEKISKRGLCMILYFKFWMDEGNGKESFFMCFEFFLGPFC